MKKLILNKIRKGFTPLELLLVVGISAVVAGLFVFTANAPRQQAALPPINVNVGQPNVTVNQPDVNVNIAPTELTMNPPVVNVDVAAPNINIPATQVNVAAPKMAAAPARMAAAPSRASGAFAQEGTKYCSFGDLRVYFGMNTRQTCTSDGDCLDGYGEKCVEPIGYCEGILSGNTGMPPVMFFCEPGATPNPACDVTFFDEGYGDPCIEPECGNGIRENLPFFGIDEVCDDGDNTDDGYCNATCDTLLDCPPNPATPLGGGEYELSPHGVDSTNGLYGACDARYIQEAIDNIDNNADITKLTLKAGTYVFGALQDVTIDKADFVLTGETGVGDSADLLPDGTTADKPLAVLMAVDSVNGYDGTFIISAKNVTVENLEMQNFNTPISASNKHDFADGTPNDTAGFVINNNRFVGGDGNIYLLPDNSSTYANWPNTDVAVKSYFTNNKLVNVVQAPHVIGSEIEFSNNSIIALYGYLFVMSIDADDHRLVKNNLFAGNYLEVTDPDGRIIYVAADDSEALVDSNSFVGNTFVGPSADSNSIGLYLYGKNGDPNINSQITNTLIADNLFDSVDVGVWLNGETPGTTNETTIVNNTFVNMFYNSIWLSRNVADTNIMSNDHKLSNLAGYNPNSVVIDIGYFGITGTYIFENKFPPGTTICSQVSDSAPDSVIHNYKNCESKIAKTVEQDVLKALVLEKIEDNTGRSFDNFKLLGLTNEDTSDTCFDGVDNDFNAFTDCKDYSCFEIPYNIFGYYSCEDVCIGFGVPDYCPLNATYEVSCSDGNDNDLDGLVDLDDPDCA